LKSTMPAARCWVPARRTRWPQHRHTFLRVPPYTESGVTETLKKARLAGAQKSNAAKRNDGSLFWTEVSLRIALIGTEHLAVAVVHDVTERKQTNERIAQLAHYDLLTGSPTAGSSSRRSIRQLRARARWQKFRRPIS